MGRLTELHHFIHLFFHKQPPVFAPYVAEDPDNKFLKGLAIVEDVAYFGIAELSERSARDNPDKNAEVAAFDLRRR